MLDPRRHVFSALCFLGALGLVVTYDFGERGRQFAPAAQAKTDRAGTWDLGKARMLTKVVGHVRNHYVDPTRVDVREMAVATLQAVQGAVPEVQVEVERDRKGVAKGLKVTVDDTARSFSLEKVGDLYELNWKLMDVFDFLERNLPPSQDLEQLEYTAVNGLLSTLDPHSILLEPRAYREMQVGTQGRFGGLGLVIGLREGTLTVMSVMPETPAARGGLQAGDQVVQVGEESTVNMPVSDAVTRMRGEPGTDITLILKRKGEDALKTVTLTREEIRIRSVEHEALGGGVGYVRIRNFQGNTFDDLEASLAALQKGPGGLQRLVLDLRDNPGGLLDQAILVSDRFLKKGTIVTTVAEGSREREERHATEGGSMADLPIVVLVNRGSASASEIVAGALKHNERALVVGSTSFGKGSVQVVYKLDEAALKLTVAQYLTPGDVSIQSVGIVPDIEILALRADAESLDLLPQELERGGEAGLKSHLESQRTKAAKPVAQLKILETPPKDGKAGHEADAKRDPLVQLARELLEAAPSAERKQALAQIAPVLARRQAAEEERLTQALAALGVDWRREVAGGKPKLEAALRIEREDGSPVDGPVEAGTKLRIVADVVNAGPRAASQVRGVLRSSVGALEGEELVFGYLEPKGERSWTVEVELPKSLESHGDLVALELFQGDEGLGRLAQAPLRLKALPRPVFAWSAQVLDPDGNGDGLVQLGEAMQVAVRVTNVGQGAAHEVLATLKNESGEEVFIESGRHRIGALAPGASATAVFELKVKDALKARAVQLALTVVDQELRTWTSDALSLTVFPKEFPAAVKAAGAVRVTGAPTASAGPSGPVTARIHAGAHRESPVVGVAEPGARLEVRARAGEWLAVAWREGEDELRGWIPRDRTVEAAGDEVGGEAGEAAVIRAELQSRPPELALAEEATALVTGSAKVTLNGVARFGDGGGQGRRDVYIFRGEDKVFFESARSVGDGDAASREALAFEALIELEPGANEITVFAREGEDEVTRRRVTVYRTGKGEGSK